MLASTRGVLVLDETIPILCKFTDRPTSVVFTPLNSAKVPVKVLSIIYTETHKHTEALMKWNSGA